MSMASIGSGVAGYSHPDHEYDDFSANVRERLSAAAAGPLFTTDADPAQLWAAYLDNLPAERQHYTCHCCRRFVGSYGGLATIDASGRVEPAAWNEADAPPFFRESIAAMARLVRKAKVTGVFLSSAKEWGTPVTGAWHHLSTTPPPSALHTRKDLTAGQLMAEKAEDYRNVRRALAEFTPPMVEQALGLLRSDSLYRSEKVIGPAQWLHDLHAAMDKTGGRSFQDNVVWRAIATAPAGFCHPRSSMVGTLLDDIAAGMDFAEVSRRFQAKMHPLQYQRPTAPPSAGNIAQAEKLVETLGIARSLDRRFARPDEVEALWRPAAPAPSSPVGGVFGHLKPKEATPAVPIIAPPITMTWEKFARTVLGTAQSIEYFVPHGYANYAALVTAVHADAPPIFQWDAPERRNPVSWYIWMHGSPASQWGLVNGRYCKVSAVTLSPPHWGPDGASKFPHQGQAVLFLLDGAAETKQAGNAIFPDCLRSEMHGVRSTIEAYSRKAEIAGLGEPMACGIMLGKGSQWNATFRVRSGGLTTDYKLDRWD